VICCIATVINGSLAAREAYSLNVVEVAFSEVCLRPYSPSSIIIRWGATQPKEDEVREMHCVCGNRLVADDDEGLVRQALTHAHEVHPEMDLTEG
jgi:predicted small metal-binding protein